MSQRKEKKKEYNVIVTVGTTKFEKFIRVFDTEEILTELQLLGVKTITVQIGRGEYIPFQNTSLALKKSMELSHFDLKPSIEEYINEADLIIGHAGVGTIVETLRANKPLLVIVNQDLMDNHQQEVASGLEKKGYINVAYPETLLETLKTKDVFHVIKYPPVDYNAFPNVVDEEMEL